MSESLASGDDLWHRLGERFGLMALRPRLSASVEVTPRGLANFVVRNPANGAEFVIDEEEHELLKQLDGSHSLAELVVERLGRTGTLQLQWMLDLVDQIIAGDMVDEYPPNLYRRLEQHLAEVGHSGELAGAIAVAPKVFDSEGVRAPVWKPRNKAMADRAKFLRSLALFKDFDQQGIGALAEFSLEEKFGASSAIVPFDDQAQRVYVVHSGDVSVLRTDERGRTEAIARLQRGDLFGDTALAPSLGARTIIRAGFHSTVVLSWPPEEFERIAAPYFPAIRAQRLTRERLGPLSRMPLFSNLDDQVRRRLALSIAEHELGEQEIVFEQGDAADRFYVIVRGLVAVERDGVEVARLGEGEFFGETGLLLSTVRNASVRALTETTLWSLDNVAFQQLVRQAMLSRRDFMPIVLNRMHRS